VRTAHSWRGILPFTHLAREGRMTVTIGRRELLAALGGAAAWPLAARGQQLARRIGMLETIPPQANAANFDALRKGLRELGYDEGRSLIIEYRSADGRAERFPALAAELVRLNVDVIVTRGTPSALAATYRHFSLLQSSSASRFTAGCSSPRGEGCNIVPIAKGYSRVSQTFFDCASQPSGARFQRAGRWCSAASGRVV